MGDIRDQLQTLTGADLTGSQLSQAGGKAFVSVNARATQKDLTEVTEFWRSVHAPSYGLPIPGSGVSVSATATATLLNLDTNQTAYINALSLTNGGGDVLEVAVTLGVARYSVQTCPPGETIIVIGAGPTAGSPFFLADGVSIGCSVSGGSIGDLTMGLAYSLAVQG